MTVSSAETVTNKIRPRKEKPRTNQVLVIVGLLVLWQIFATIGSLGAVPTPVEVTVAFGSLLAGGTIWSPLGETMLSWALSLVAATIVGVAVGFPLGVSRIAYRMSALTLDFLRTIPALVLVPLVALLFGAGIESVVVLAFLAAVWAVLMQAIYGVHDVDPVARETFRSLRVRKIDYVRLLLLPSAAPYLSTGIRLAAAVCLLVSISAQIVIPAGGLGEAILIAQLGGAVPEMYAYIFLCGLLGIAIDAAFRAMERRALNWHPAHRKTRTK
ncbi:MAG TPA: ABC transporter permease subunit [Enteractinococcus helveticum]|uniref:ABC transporter permease subunit n=1 Tax=Enteractinococcus helveticum TaxID=1837282 RepID=A0A921FNA5_9MICC|nr:ABC transporter permease subunit [Enteractinococcus helveticum]HJF14611.1 ABC transporter permease subunit [Enteractinococcus helveticum]